MTSSRPMSGAQMRFRHGILLSTIALVVAANVLGFRPLPAAGQTPQQFELCAASLKPDLVSDGPTRDLMIASCTVLIQSGKFAGDRLAKVFLTRGGLYLGKFDYDRAFADSQEAVRLDPRSAAAFRLRGYSYGEKKDYDRAIADYDEAIRLAPDDPDAWFSRGVVYRSKGDIRRAIADWNEAIRLDPKFISAIYGRGFAYQATGDYDLAIADYDLVIRLGSEHYPHVFSYRGNAWFGKKEYDRALADYEVVLKINPKHAVALYARGMTRKRKGIAGGDADMAAAMKISPTVARTAGAYGVK